MSRIIFSTGDFLVRYVEGGGSGGCVVCFSSFTDDPSLDRPGFGESFLCERGVDALHVVNRTNVWYQYREMPAALREIRSFTRAYSRVLTYGSSMGGYAAIRFAEAAGARTAIAISPQFSGSPKKAPYDRRWKSIASRVEFIHEEEFRPSAAVETLVFYDPRDADARHFELIAAVCPRAVGVRLRHAGHPAGAYLAETGLLSGVISDAIHGAFDPAAVERAARAQRRQSGQYFFTLARRLPPWRGAMKRGCAAAATASSRDAVYHIYLSLLLEQSGELRDAERHLEQALDILPDHPASLRAACVFLSRRGRYREAAAAGARLARIDPAHAEYGRLLRADLLGARDYRKIASQLQAQIEAAPGRRLGLKLAAFALRLLSRARLDILALVGLRPLALARLRRKIRLDEELDRFDEWRDRRPRGRLASRRRLS